MAKVNKQNAAQFARFLLTGVLNTLVTLIVIFVLKSLFGLNEWVSNLVGYLAGVVNSFVWNKMWVFRSHKHQLAGEVMRFAGVFIVCYLIQLGTLRLLVATILPQSLEISFGIITLSGYGLATLAAMCVFTVCNFVLNRIVTFR